jgi:hypothetical protein
MGPILGPKLGPGPILAFPARSARGTGRLQGGVIANWQSGDILIGRLQQKSDSIVLEIGELCRLGYGGKTFSWCKVTFARGHRLLLPTANGRGGCAITRPSWFARLGLARQSYLQVASGYPYVQSEQQPGDHRNLPVCHSPDGRDDPTDRTLDRSYVDVNDVTLFFQIYDNRGRMKGEFYRSKPAAIRPVCVIGVAWGLASGCLS